MKFLKVFRRFRQYLCLQFVRFGRGGWLVGRWTGGLGKWAGDFEGTFIQPNRDIPVAPNWVAPQIFLIKAFFMFIYRMNNNNNNNKNRFFVYHLFHFALSKLPVHFENHDILSAVSSRRTYIFTRLAIEQLPIDAARFQSVAL